MPWIREEMCIGCGVCVDACYTGAITLPEPGTAFIDEDECIRCGVCHDVCPEDAVRHDGERIPDEVESNLTWSRELLAHEYYADSAEKQALLIERLGRYFTKEKRVAEQTIDRLEGLLDPTEEWRRTDPLSH
ncbi:MAG: 4Fe-4S binding protein [Anaerolineae bacterium]|jgi:MinD superfamily P-loop ATPase